MRISDWSSDVCSSDLRAFPRRQQAEVEVGILPPPTRAHQPFAGAIGVVEQHRSAARNAAEQRRSEERRVGKECVSPCRSRWSPYHSKKKQHTNTTYAT